MTPFTPSLLSILIADDNESERVALCKILERCGYKTSPANDGAEALATLRKEKVDLLITDLKMPKVDGEQLLKVAKMLKPDIEVIIITGHGTVEQAVEMMKMGAYDFIEKPIKKLFLLKIIEKALERQQLARQNEELTRLMEEHQKSHEFIGKSPNFTRIIDLASQVAASEATVLIEGESGTGKELLSEFIQRHSPRKDKPFIKLNCATIPESLLESELFGYEKGAFTGAYSSKPGRFELAHTGTLFLDEVGEMSPAVQSKVLRVIENGEFERVGGTKTLAADVRLIAATNADLAAKVRDKQFREDLFYRLHVIQMIIPPLRERRQDIPLLAFHFLKFYSKKNGKRITGFSEEVLEHLENYRWPGNVRELENVIERAVVLSKGTEITLEDLPPEVVEDSHRSGYVTFAIGTPLEEIEKKMIEETLKYSHGDKEAAAKLLGTSIRTIYRKIFTSL